MSSGRPAILVIGNPGTGKSTLLNCLAGKVLFGSGIGHKGTEGYAIKYEEGCDCNLIDTPGMGEADSIKREAAVKAVMEALKTGGHFRILFTAECNDRGLRPDSVAAMRMVLSAAPAIKNYGVIITKVDDDAAKDFASPKFMATVMKQLWDDLPREQHTTDIMIWKFATELHRKSNVIISLPPDLLDQIDSVGVTHISERDVGRVDPNDIEKKTTEEMDHLLAIQTKMAHPDSSKEVFGQILEELREHMKEKFKQDAAIHASLKQDITDLMLKLDQQGQVHEGHARESLQQMLTLTTKISSMEGSLSTLHEGSEAAKQMAKEHGDLQRQMSLLRNDLRKRLPVAGSAQPLIDKILHHAGSYVIDCVRDLACRPSVIADEE